MQRQNWLLTVTGKDGAGIIAKITGFLYNLKFNLEDISMTILDGEFAMMLVFHGASSAKTMALLSAHLRTYEKDQLLNCFLKPLTEKLKRGEVHAKGTSRYLITALGRDKTGIVYKISHALAQHHLNITDLNSKILGEGPRCIYSMLLEVDVPFQFPIDKLERAMRRLQRELKIEIRIKPVEPIQF